jgi:hypothetical protein
LPICHFSESLGQYRKKEGFLIKNFKQLQFVQFFPNPGITRNSTLQFFFFFKTRRRTDQRSSTEIQSESSHSFILEPLTEQVDFFSSEIKKKMLVKKK